MIIPWGTDAPIYHRPVATIGLIVLNTMVFLLFPARAHEGLTLILGEGIHPLQWTTNIFLHAGIFHLAGNMIFLWTFGFLIEGKVGWLAFLMIYLGLGIVESAGIQLLVQGEQGFAVLGSSNVIFGLLTICLVWAPRNEVICIVWLRFTPMEFDLSILWFAVLYIAMDVLTSGMSGVIMANLTNHSSGVILTVALAQTIGALLGFAVGVAMVKFKLVDCENWDLFAVLKGRAGMSKKQAAKLMKPKRRSRSSSPRRRRRSPSGLRRTGRPRIPSRIPPPPCCEPCASTLKSARWSRRSPFIARRRVRPPDGGPRNATGADLIESLLGQDFWEDGVQVMRDYVRNQPDPSPRIRLKLAQVLIQKLGRPLQGLRLLGQFPDGSLPESLETIRNQLVRQAEVMQEDGPLELEDELW